MSLNRLWTFLAVALPVLAALLASLSSVDLAYHLRAGEEIVRTGAIPRVDNWTFTANGLPWLDQQWGSQIILSAVYQVGGWTGLALLRAGLVGMVFGAVLLIGLRRGLAPRNAAFVTLGAFAVAAPALALRPQLLGMACFAILLVLVSERRRHPAGLWATPFLVLIWANLHGSFFLAPVVLGLAWLEDVAERQAGAHRTLLIALVSVATACVTPFGPAVWRYAVGLSTNPEVASRITEWQPTTIRDGTGILFFISLAAVVTLMARSGRTVPWATLAWIGVFAAIGLYAQRGLAWWSLAGAVAVIRLLPRRADAPEPETPPTLRRLNVAVAAILVLAGIALLPMWRPPDAGTGVPVGVLTDAPPGVTAALRTAARSGDHVFNPQPWGSWFEFALPDLKSGLDSRIEFFPADVWEDYQRVVAGAAGWEERLATWNVAIVVVQAADEAFRDRLVAAGWSELYRDPDGAILRAPTTQGRASVQTRFSGPGRSPSAVLVDRRWRPNGIVHDQAGVGAVRHGPHHGRQPSQQHREPVDVHDR